MKPMLPKRNHPGNFENIIALVNHHSSNARGAMAQLADLQAELHIPIQAIESTTDRHANTEKLHETLAEGDLLVAVGGDGTVNNVVNALSSGPLKGLLIPALLIDGGNGNDLVNMQRRDNSSLSALVRSGSTIAIHPIRSELSGENGERELYAAGYMGLGATALGAQKLNDPSYRNHWAYKHTGTRQIRELRTLGDVLANAKPFVVVDDSGEHELIERTIANGPRMAKYLHPPVEITEQRIFVADVEARDRLGVANWLGKMAIPALFGKTNGQYLSIGESLDFSIINRPVLFHADAEPELLLPETKVQITQDKVPFYVLGKHKA